LLQNFSIISLLLEGAIRIFQVMVLANQPSLTGTCAHARHRPSSARVPVKREAQNRSTEHRVEGTQATRMESIVSYRAYVRLGGGASANGWMDE
jgi:hypothetical protein